MNKVQDQVKEFSCALATLSYMFSLAEEENIPLSIVFKRVKDLMTETGRKFEHVSR